LAQTRKSIVFFVVGETLPAFEDEDSSGLERVGAKDVLNATLLSFRRKNGLTTGL
jgi:hypothetical protein